MGTDSYPPVPVQETQASSPVRRLEAIKLHDMDIGSPTLLADVHAEFTGTRPDLVEVETTGSTLTGLDALSSLATGPIPRQALLGWGEARMKSAQENTELRAVACDGLVFTNLDLWVDSKQSESETGPWPSLDASTSEGFKTNALSKSPGVPKSSPMVQRGRGTVIQIRASARRKARQKWREDRDDLAVRQDIVYRIERWAKVEVETTGSTLTGLDALSSLATGPIPRQALLGWGEARMKSAQENTELRAVACDGLVFTNLDLWVDSKQSESETGPWPSLDASTSEGFKTNALSKSPGVPKSSPMVQRGRGTVIQIRASARRKARQKWREDRDDLAVRQDIVYRIERWAKSTVEDGHFKDFTDVFSSKRLARFPKLWDKTKDGLSQPWSGENLWLHPPDELWEQTVQKVKFEQGQGIAISTYV